VKQTFEIRGHAVGTDAPCFVIAEAGSNHNNSLELARSLIDVAAAAEANAVKFQTFKAKRLYPKSAGQSDYLGDARSIYDIIAAMEMPEAWLPELCDYAHSKGRAFISTPFHEEAVEVLAPFVDAFKIASYEMNHHPLLRAVARQGKPVIMSTGASNLEEVRRSVEVLQEEGCEALVLLQCTAAYPAPPESVNVSALVTLREAIGVPTGLSDHSRDPVVAPMVAAALGAAVLEKHYTLSNHLPGPDHAFAVEPHELARLVKRVRDVEQVLGSGAKTVHGVEDELRAFARRSVFALRPIAIGEVFSAENVDVLRNGKHAQGLEPEWLDAVIGQVARTQIAGERPLTWQDVELDR